MTIRWEVQEYCKDRKEWRCCMTCDTRSDAVGHCNLLDRMYKSTMHRVLEITERSEVIYVGGYDPDKVVR